MKITDYIPVGKANAVTRAELVALTGISDRRVRRLIAEARVRGVPIINNQDGRGYYISEDLQELRRQYGVNRRRALSILRQQRYIRRKIEEVELRGQPSLFEREVEANDRQQNKGR